MSYKGYFREMGRQGSDGELVRYQQWFFPQLNLLEDRGLIPANGPVLEVGSGIGGFYALLPSHLRDSYVGLELDEECVAWANERFPGDHMHCTRIEDFEPAERFSAIYAFEVLEHVDNPSEVLRILLSRLKPSGFLCITSPYPFRKNVRADADHLHVLHPENWIRLFERTGFRDVSASPMSFIPYVWRKNKRLNVRLPFYLSLPYFISTALIVGWSAGDDQPLS